MFNSQSRFSGSDNNSPDFDKVFVLNYHKDDDLVLKFDVYDGDEEHHPSMFHFPEEKDRLGEVIVR
mgnify:CR=1 FL=1